MYFYLSRTRIIVFHKATGSEKALNEQLNLRQIGCGNIQKKKLTLKQLQMQSPPGYKKLEAALGSQDLDEELALQLWEDIFKPLSSFDLPGIDGKLKQALPS